VKKEALEVILTHESADFDAVASLLGASKLFPGAVPILPHRVNRNCADFVALYGSEVPLVAVSERPQGRIGRAILVDTQSFNMLKGMSKNLRVDIIDHHALDRELPPDWHFTGVKLGAITTLLVEAISARSLHLNDIEATLLLLGIYEDTGSLSYESTTPRDVRAAAWLMERGARLAVANKFLHHPLTPAQRALYEQLVTNSQGHEILGHHIVIASAVAATYTEEISTLAHRLREVLEPAALFLLVDLGGHIQLVARSTTDEIDVSQVAAHFGGGGHTRAAAALIDKSSLDATHSELLGLLPELVHPSTTVAQMMSRGVQILDPDMTIALAAQRMRRTGHEGYPIVDDGQVIGLLTRRDVDRALQFKMDNAPARQVMHVGSITVSPQDSIERLRNVMIQSGWGQIPVVENGQVIGVVTRTDLISLWGAPQQAPYRQEIPVLLRSALSPSVLVLVRRISEQAQGMGVIPHFVGGLVRDLLLDEPIVDIDLVIEGDAIALARRVAAQMGGRIRAHRQFGTAKWLLSSDVWEKLALSTAQHILPKSIDFVTARTEFYRHPTALPEVESSSIRPDLQRRDFTINTLAIRLDPKHWGELLDYFGGETDLRNGIIRVLHSLSFVDDPTRILRAARLEARLGFHLDPHSEGLIANALPLLDRVSGPRLRHELELIFQEPQPELALSRLDEWGVLSRIHNGLRCDDWLQSKFVALRGSLDRGSWELKASSDFFLYLGLLAYRMSRKQVDIFVRRLQISRRDTAILQLSVDLKDSLSDLTQAESPSTVYDLLKPYPASVLALTWVANNDNEIRNVLIRFQTKWRPVRSILGGKDLVEMGLEPGPLFGRLLESLRAARLDGRVITRQDEEELIRNLLKLEGRPFRGDQSTDQETSDSTFDIANARRLRSASEVDQSGNASTNNRRDILE